MRDRSLTARALSRYFLDEGITSYTHVCDQHATYGTQIIVSTDRDATYVLDEILGNTTELPIMEGRRELLERGLGSVTRVTRVTRVTGYSVDSVGVRLGHDLYSRRPRIGLERPVERGMER